jgi:hypothetical protein
MFWGLSQMIWPLQQHVVMWQENRFPTICSFLEKPHTWKVRLGSEIPQYLFCSSKQTRNYGRIGGAFLLFQQWWAA